MHLAILYMVDDKSTRTQEKQICLRCKDIIRPQGERPHQEAKKTHLNERLDYLHLKRVTLNRE